MRAIILAAGVGSRLFGDDRKQPPKSLIEFNGKTLLARHIELLREFGIDGLTLVVGYRQDLVSTEAMSCASGDYIEIIENPMYRGGSMISLWHARATLRSGDDTLFMDADTLYDPALLKRLIDSPVTSAFSYDKKLDEGEDPVRICLRNGEIADFGKQIVGQFDAIGERPGFSKFSPETSGKLADSVERHVEAGHLMSPCEDAMRDMILGEHTGTFGIVDISDLKWVEIDFPDDLQKAQDEILPNLKA